MAYRQFMRVRRNILLGKDEDIDIEDTEYADILLACTKHLVQTIKLADEELLKKLSNWLEERAQSFQDLLLTKLDFLELILCYLITLLFQFVIEI